MLPPPPKNDKISSAFSYNFKSALTREFEPQVLKKNQTSISQDIEEKILSMYAKGKLDT